MCHRGGTTDREMRNAIVSMAAASSTTPPEQLPITCPGCFLSYGDFVATYHRDTEGLIKLLMNHGLIPEKKLCEKCGKECRLDLRRKAFRCDKTFRKGKKAAQKCNFQKTLLRGTWLDKSHLDIETNIRFVNLFVRDYFSYKVVENISPFFMWCNAISL